MDPHAATLVQTLKGLMREDPRSIFYDRTEYRYFLTLVNKLQAYARDLSTMERGFLGRLKRIKSRSLMDVAFAREVEKADGRNYRATSALSDEMVRTRENMRMREANLATSFHAESQVDKRIAALEEEMADLKKRKREIQEDVHGDITAILQKRRDMKALERARVNLWGEMDEVSARARHVEGRFQALDVMWEDARSFSTSL
ncbi:hypothetical protein A2U01_0017851 [Trifolium medium]|uniref:Uncharacterized protein n=1 Tax=Trifolium medium TaxID=97028 RepID=A0A392NBL6_9FABA|nr:hypothetical protein [Trifolium medium]